MCENLVQLMSALSEAIRIRALKILWDGEEYCTCELMQALSVSQSRMSRHMAVLKRAGLVTSRRQAQWILYQRAKDISPCEIKIIESVLAVAERHPTLKGKERCCAMKK